MASHFTRYMTAFWKALQLTLRGETLPTPNLHPELTAWMQQAVQLTAAVFKVTEDHGLDLAARKNLMLHLDKRDIAMQTILETVQHNLIREYPLLLKSQVSYYLGAIQALNVNDCYRVSQLAAALSDYPPVQQAVQMLQTHLETCPAIQPVPQD